MLTNLICGILAASMIFGGSLNEGIGLSVSEPIAFEALSAVRRAATNSNTEGEDVLEDAISLFEAEFPSYLDITALSVYAKSEVNLPGFDPDYVAPSFEEIAYDYQWELEDSLNGVETIAYDNLCRAEYYFDRYVSLNACMFESFYPATRFSHATIPGDPSNPITPFHPSIGNGGRDAGVLSMLASAGLGEASLVAFSSAISALTVLISSSALTIVGMILAAAIIAGILITIATIIIENWPAICSFFQDIADWFVEEFNTVADSISSFFESIGTKGYQSTIAGTQTIGDREIVWVDSNMTLAKAIAIAEERRRDPVNVLLMREQYFPRTNEMSWWVATAFVTESFVINHQLYEQYYISTYTWYNNRAKRMLYEGAPSYAIYGGYGYKNVAYHRFTDMNHAIYGWDHYHMGWYNATEGKTETYKKTGIHYDPIYKAHSFFGLTYFRLPDGSGFESYPENP